MKNNLLLTRGKPHLALAFLMIAALLLGAVGISSQAARAQTTNLALNKPVTCSSTENAGTACANAVDGSTTTRWSSAFSDPQWIRVDLGAVYNLTSVVLRWEAAYAKAFQIQASTDGTTWTNLYTTTTGTGGVQTLTVSGSGRYVRMNGTVRATAYGYSLWEFEVYGTSGVITPTLTRTPNSSLPDLTISSITYVGSNPPCANQPRDNVVVSNIGGGNAGTFVVSFGPSYTQTVTSLPAGQSITLSFPAIMGTSTATADSTSMIIENNESNNSMSASLPAPTQAPTCTPTPTATPTNTGTPGNLPDLTVLSITEFTYSVPSPTPNAQGCWQSGPSTAIGLRVTVQNIGSANAGSFVVSLLLNGTNYNKTVSGLAASQTLAVDISPVPLPRTRTATVDSSSMVTESNETNNTFTLNLPAATATRTGTPPPMICLTSTPTRTITSTPTTRPGCGTVVVVTLTPTPTFTATPRTATATATTCGPIFVTVTPTPTPSRTRTLTPTPTLSTSNGNVALNRPVTCSSVENAGTACANAVDGNTTTRWASAFSDPQWIQVDLGTFYTLSRVVLRWEAAYARSFQIQVSTDGSAWTDLYSTTTGTGGTQSIPVAGLGRYVRMYGTARATSYGYSLWEFEVYANTTPTPSMPAVTGSVLVGGGACCVGGVAGSIVNINASFSATSSAAAITQMRVRGAGGGCATEAVLSQSAWEPFVTTKTFQYGPIPINWSGFYVTVQYRDAAGNLSALYCDDISVEGMPPTPTKTATPIP